MLTKENNGQAAPSRLMEHIESLLRPSAAAAEKNAACRGASGPLCREEELSLAAAPNRSGDSPAAAAPQAEVQAVEKFTPLAPTAFSSLQLAQAEVEGIVLKAFLNSGAARGCDVAQQIALPFPIVEKFLHAMKADRLLAVKGAATMRDYLYELTEAGMRRAREYAQHCSYCGTVPVALEEYAASVAAQSLANAPPCPDDLRRAFAGLVIAEDMLRRLARAVVSGKGLFLYGSPGNGKTAIAERITHAYGTSIWIPRSLSAWGEIIRLYDPSCHEELPVAAGEGLIADEKIDHRWVRIRRPTIVVGGELQRENMELTVNKESGTCEAPIQLKSNGGTLIIDDFGRQQIPPAALLNRWIVPMEKRYDFLNLASGRKIQVPFNQFIVFSTNLEPKDLVDEAFLRRIPYKIDVRDPTEDQFRFLFRNVARQAGIEHCEESLTHLIETYYKSAGREMRFCHPRDLAYQIKVYCQCLQTPLRMSIDAMDCAANDYFAIL